MEHAGFEYTYCASVRSVPSDLVVECDPYAKPQALLDVSPRGLVPGLKLDGSRALSESVVIMEVRVLSSTPADCTVP